ncbi:hypothetical protein C1H46_010407 [Malus baccata]|uniref:Uncharacterized protein n=1 Tax=Malus baccata TaxID=106549 RepID=A0A540MZ12_MALBA|nr:hypothetical protein C1H46_010407 [Malus baccata]
MALLTSFIEVHPYSHFPIQNLPYSIFKPQPSSSTNSEEDYSSPYLQTPEEIQSDLLDIGKACDRLKQWEDDVNDAVRKLVLQGLDELQDVNSHNITEESSAFGKKLKQPMQATLLAGEGFGS